MEKKEIEVRIFSSFEAAEEADSEYFRGLTPHQRLEILLDLLQCADPITSEGHDNKTSSGMERVFRIAPIGEG